jgi:thioredoxin 1
MKQTRFLIIVAIAVAAIIFVKTQRGHGPGAGVPVTGPLAEPGMVTLVEFGAAWCPPCRQMQPVLHALEEKYRGRAVVRPVDVDANGDLASRNGVQSIPALVFYGRDGKESYRHVGFLDQKDCERILDRLIGG